MIDKKISNLEFSTLNFFLTRAFLIGITFNTIVNIIHQDSWIIPIISIIPAVIFILIINYIMKYEPNLDISQKLTKLFKKKIGNIFIIVLVIISSFICILNYLTLNNFIQSQFLNNTPLFAISIMFAITTLYILSKGLITICRSSSILFYIGIIMCIISLLGLMPACKFDNLKPFFNNDMNSYINCINIYYSFNIIPMFVLTIIPKNKIDNPKIKLSLIISYFLSAFTIFIIMVQTISIFGYELTSLYEYPEFLVLKHFTLLGLSSRIESLLIIQLLFDVFMFNILITYFISNNIKYLFNTKRANIIYFIVLILIIIGTLYASRYNTYIDNIISNYFSIILNSAMVIILFIICIKIKMSK